MALWRQERVKLIKPGCKPSGVKLWCHDRGAFVIVPVVAVEDTPSEMETSDVKPATERAASMRRAKEYIAGIHTKLESPIVKEALAYPSQLHTVLNEVYRALNDLCSVVEDLSNDRTD